MKKSPFVIVQGVIYKKRNTMGYISTIKTAVQLFPAPGIFADLALHDLVLSIWFGQ